MDRLFSQKKEGMKMVLKNKYPYIGEHIRLHKLPSGGVIEIDVFKRRCLNCGI